MKERTAPLKQTITIWNFDSLAQRVKTLGKDDGVMLVISGITPDSGVTISITN